MSSRRILILLVCLFGLVRDTPLAAATSTAWETSGFADIAKGRLSGLMLTVDGVLQPGPARRWGTALGQPAFWSIAVAPDGTAYAATGHTGRLFRMDKNGSSTEIWKAEQPEIFALALDPRGRLYAATSPNGGVYRIENGHAQEVWHSAAKYIWNLQFASDGSLFIATGEAGQIYRLNAAGRAELYYQTGQANVTALAFGANQHLYAGTEPNGILYEISGSGRASVLYDSSLPEIRAIVPTPDGGLYVAAMGGALSTRTTTAATNSSSASPVVSASAPTVITVTEAQRSPQSQNEQATVKTPASPPASASTAASTPAAASAGSVTEVAGVEKSAIYRIAPDRSVTTLRSSKDDNVYDLLLLNGQLYFSTDDHGRVYRLDGLKVTLWTEAGEGEATRLAAGSGSTIFVGLSNPARLQQFDPNGQSAASYQSQVHDSGTVARWGHLQWRPGGLSNTSSKGLRFHTRTGNSARPDSTWSNWSTAISDPQQALISSPIARYIQWRAEWESASTAECRSVSIPYLAQNSPPNIRSISVSSVLGSNPVKATASASSNTSAYSVTVTDTGEAAAATATGAAGQNVSRLQSTQTQVTWQADDPDADKLVYSLYFRPEEAHDWQLIRSRMSENTLLLDPDVFADGHYLFRIVASDAPSNAPEYAQQTELVSAPVLIDNTAPVILTQAPQRAGATADIDLSARDEVSSLRRCEYSLDAGFWQPVEAADGITDTPQERFHIHLDKLRSGEHLLVIRVYDSVGNAGLARVLLH